MIFLELSRALDADVPDDNTPTWVDSNRRLASSAASFGFDALGGRRRDRLVRRGRSVPPSLLHRGARARRHRVMFCS